MDRRPFTSANHAAFTEGMAGTFTPTATGAPTPTITESGPLPTGVTFTGTVLTGTPTATGSFPITFTAANGITPNATQDFTLTVGVSARYHLGDQHHLHQGHGRQLHPDRHRHPAPTITESGRPARRGHLHSRQPCPARPPSAGTFPITFTAANGIRPTPPRPSP